MPGAKLNNKGFLFRRYLNPS